MLLDVLEASGDQPARVQFWVDGHVAEARPDLVPALARIGSAYPGRFASAGEVQVVPGGEAVKNDFAHLDRMLRAINDADLDRRSYMVVVGGGAVLDAVGFAAALPTGGFAWSACPRPPWPRAIRASA